MPREYDPRAAERGLFDALIEARDRYGAKKPILEDQERRPLSYTDLIRGTFALGRKIADITTAREHVGVMLPTSSAGIVTFFALHAFGRTPTMINFTAGIRNIRAACKMAGVKRVLTSRRFVEQAKLEDVVDALEAQCAITYLEDVRRTIGTLDKAYAFAAGVFPKQFRAAASPDDPGVILFTSGSFGAPRGVVLSQRNMLANVEQVAAVIDFDLDWVIFNPLPIFHCFGLTGGVTLPLMYGMKVFAYPSPLHTKIIPSLIRDLKASVLFATDTFLNHYVRAAEPGDLGTLELVVCGAERVRQETHQLVAEKVGPVPLLEGYGATEASPVISVNTPLDNRHGTVGVVMPKMETRLEPVDGIHRGARLFVRGPNIMAGYLNEDGRLEPPKDGWHDTGDVVEISDDGWITILGRVKRFAKVAGEMVSLTAAESLAAHVWPDSRHAVIAQPDPKRGERLVLVTDRYDAATGPLISYAQSIGASELVVPKKIIRVHEVPVLGSGKTDYVAIQRMAELEARAA